MNRKVLNTRHFDKHLKGGGSIKTSVKDLPELSNLTPATHHDVPAFKQQTINDPNMVFNNTVPLTSKVGTNIIGTLDFGTKRKSKNIKLKL